MDSIKYPKTLHIDGSKVQLSTCNPNIGNKESTSALQLSKSETIVIEEKVKGLYIKLKPQIGLQEGSG